jgi:tetratricopeptide (TPR) repeat protein
MGKPKEAIGVYRELLAANGENVPVWLQLGTTLADTFDFQGAVEAFQKATKLAPGNAAAFFHMGRIYYDLGRYPEASAALEQSAMLEPKNLSTVLMWGLSEMRGQERGRAQGLFQRMLEMQPGNGEALFLLGLNQYLGGEKDAAVGFWQKAALAYPPHPEALEYLIRLKPERAEIYRTQLESWQQKLHATTKEEVQIGLGLTAAAGLDWTRAMEHLRQAEQLCGKCRHAADIHKQMGIFYAKTGAREKAIAELTAAVAQKTKDPSAAALLELLRKPQ